MCNTFLIINEMIYVLTDGGLDQSPMLRTKKSRSTWEEKVSNTLVTPLLNVRHFCLTVWFSWGPPSSQFSVVTTLLQLNLYICADLGKHRGIRLY